uniref:Generative cell specific-1/HAP2 domain-containing protein n=1 Tax=Trypanosoma congolense (strain IL3000) TaxID=1068625 RepID=G0UXL2_TRYCI|nr:conserved hypothetical protein [Trypanosoma congolense IL3000]
MLNPALVPFLTVAALAVVYYSPITEGAIVASSSVEHCERDGRTETFPCERKLVVTLSVDSEQTAGAEEVIFLREALDKTGNRKEKRVFVEPIRLVTIKSAVHYRYPVYYVQNFNAKPYEQQLTTTAMEWCKDYNESASPTCGLARDSSGRVIPYSQGFCCSCGACELSGICRPKSRGASKCSIIGNTGKASCLRFGNMWYSGYNIGRGTVWYRLQVGLTTQGAVSGDGVVKPNQHMLSLGPDTITASSAEFGVSARLIGDFAPSEMPLDLTNKMLFAPAVPRTHERVRAGHNEWIFLDKHLVSVHGRECNRVGVSYEGFATQGGRCSALPGACLANQLDDYRGLDLKSESEGRKGHYMARFFGEFKTDSHSNSSAPRITYQTRNSLATMVTITILADKLKFVLSVSPGTIVNVTVSGTNVASYSRGNTVTINVLNTGDVEAQYTVGVGNCTIDAHPMVAQVAFIPPLHSVQRNFSLVSQSDSLVEKASCTASLQNARGDVVDTYTFYFDVKPVGWTNGSQGGEVPGGSGVSKVAKAESQCEQCRWYNLLCFLIFGCWWQPLLFVFGSLSALALLQCFLESRSGSSGRREMFTERFEPASNTSMSPYSVMCAPRVSTVRGMQP